MLKRFDGGSKSSKDWDGERGIKCNNVTDVIKAHKALREINVPFKKHLNEPFEF